MKFIDDAIKESEQRMEEKAPEKLSSDIDDELIEMIKGAKTNIYVVLDISVRKSFTIFEISAE